MSQPVLTEVLEVLEATPAALRALLEGLSGPWLTADEGPETFSPLDVLGHLIHGEETDWMVRVGVILEHGPARPFPAFDRFGFRETHGGRPLDDLLDTFTAGRRANLARLRALELTPAQLALPGTHPALGPVTLGQLLATWAAHDLGHIGQVVRVLSRRYRDAVGPWRAYLRLLQD